MALPYGLFVDTAAVVVGALLGIGIGKHIPQAMKESLTLVFGLICFALGITLIVEVNALIPVGLALILGTALGELLDLEGKIALLLGKAQGALSRRGPDSGQSQNLNGVIMLIPLFCFSTTVIVGGINEAIGVRDMLLIKAVLDFFTAIIFAASYGALVGLLSIPLFLMGILFYLLSALLIPVLTPAMTADMNAAGGVHCVACALGVMGIRQMKVNNMIPALLLALPISALWSLFL